MAINLDNIIINRIGWKDDPDTSTPLDSGNLKEMENNAERGINELKTNVQTAFTDLLKLVFPIGSTYITQDNTDPKSILGFGTWERLKGKVVVGLDEDDADGYFDEIGKTGGEKKHQLTIDELANHSHGNVYVESGNGNLQETHDWFTGVSWGNKKGLSWVGAAGKDQAHNNIQPYQVVGYMWIRKS